MLEQVLQSYLWRYLVFFFLTSERGVDGSERKHLDRIVVESEKMKVQGRIREWCLQFHVGVERFVVTT